MPIMLKVRSSSQIRLLAAATLALLLAGLGGAGFAAWIGEGDRLLFAMIQSGLAWCF